MIFTSTQKRGIASVIFRVISLIMWFPALLHAQQITSFSPLEIIGGKNEVLTINGSGFGMDRGSSYVSFFRESNGYYDEGTALFFDYMVWTDDEIRLAMPIAFSGLVKVVVNGNEVFSTDTLKVKANLGYRQVFPLIYDYLSQKNSIGGITWYVHPAYWNRADIKEAIADVVQEFRCKTGVNYIIAPLEEEVPIGLGAERYLIAPDSMLGPVGFNDKLWRSCINGGEVFYYNDVQVLRFNTRESWYYGKGKAPDGMAKFRYVLLHEMGHSLGLGHVNEWGESMFPSVTLLPSDEWSERDTITTSEVTAMRYYVDMCQRFTFRGCGVSPMLPNEDCREVYGLMTGVADVMGSATFVLSPNPITSGTLRIQLPYVMQTVSARVQIVDMMGREVLHMPLPLDGLVVLPSNISNGMYGVQVLGGSHRMYQKVLVQQ